jgi:transposase InsO family protein
VKYQFIADESKNYTLKVLCRVLEVSRSGFYDWRGRPKSKRLLEDEKIVEQIKLFHCGSRCTYGSPRIHQDFKGKGQRVGKNRIARLMRQQGIQGRCKRRFKNTTQSKHNRPVAENHLNQQFEATTPNQKWVSDLSYVWTWEGWLYLAIVLDLYSRAVVGWAMSHTMTDDLTLDALKMALRRREPPIQNHLLFHSDRGSQYASNDFRAELANYQITQSMSRTGNCYDNAAMESFFATLKTEEVYPNIYQSRQQAKSSIFSYIEGFYNRSRRHSALGYLSPMDFEQLNRQTISRVA